MLRTTLCVSQPVSLLEAEAARTPVVSQRFTVSPLSFFAMKFLSRSSFISLAMRVKASSQEMRFHSLLPGARYSGYCRRLGLCTKSSRPAPFGHSVPRFTGWSGSPSMWMISACAFLDLSQAVHQQAAAHRAVGTGVAGLGRTRELERPHFRQRLAGR